MCPYGLFIKCILRSIGVIKRLLVLLHYLLLFIFFCENANCEMRLKLLDSLMRVCPSDTGMMSKCTVCVEWLQAQDSGNYSIWACDPCIWWGTIVISIDLNSHSNLSVDLGYASGLLNLESV